VCFYYVNFLVINYNSTVLLLLTLTLRVALKTPLHRDDINKGTK